MVLVEYFQCPKSCILILFGSQTGNSERLAIELCKDLFRCGVFSRPLSIDEYEIEDLTKEKQIIFIVSTCGQGEPPDSMKRFWRILLKKNLSPFSLQGVSYCVFGLGDSSYKKYNFVAKVLDSRLESLGALRFLPLGEGDDQDNALGFWSGFNRWRSALFFHFNLTYINSLPFKFDIEFKNDVDASDSITQPHSSSVAHLSLTVKHVIRLTCESHFQNVSEFTFSTEEVIGYEPGDTLIIFPRNFKDDIEYLYSFFGWGTFKNLPIKKLKSCRPDGVIPSNLIGLKGVTLDELLTSMVHISNCCPDQGFFHTLKEIFQPFHGKDPVLDLWIEKFAELSQNLDEYLSYCYRPKRRIVEIIKEFAISSSFSLSHFGVDGICINYIFDLFSWIKPRQFSISSSSLANNFNNINITVALIDYKIGPFRRVGFCSAYLRSLAIGDQVNGCIQKDHGLIFPTLEDQFEIHPPLLFLCAGTGIAPMKAFIEKCAFLQKRNMLPKLEICLVFGCRFMNKDALYINSEDFLFLEREDILQIISKGSRDGELPKPYIDRMVRTNGNLICDLILRKGASIYLCGNPELPKAIRAVFIELIGEDTFGEIEKAGRFHVESW